MISQVENGGVTKQTTMKLKDWLAKFVEEYKPNIQATTRAGYEEKIQNCVTPYIGNIQVKALTTDAIQKWVNQLSKSGSSPKTIRNAFNIVNAAMKKAVVTGMVSRNPCEGVELPKLERFEAHVYGTDTIKKALALSENDPTMHLILVLLLSLGLRRVNCVL